MSTSLIKGSSGGLVKNVARPGPISNLEKLENGAWGRMISISELS